MTRGEWVPLGTSDVDLDVEWLSMWSILDAADRRTRWQRFRQRWHEFWVHRFLWQGFIIRCSKCPYPKPEPYGPFGYMEPANSKSIDITVDDDSTERWPVSLEKKERT